MQEATFSQTTSRQKPCNQFGGSGGPDVTLMLFRVLGAWKATTHVAQSCSEPTPALPQCSSGTLCTCPANCDFSWFWTALICWSCDFRAATSDSRSCTLLTRGSKSFCGTIGWPFVKGLVDGGTRIAARRYLPSVPLLARSVERHGENDDKSRQNRNGNVLAHRRSPTYMGLTTRGVVIPMAPILRLRPRVGVCLHRRPAPLTLPPPPSDFTPEIQHWFETAGGMLDLR